MPVIDSFNLNFQKTIFLWGGCFLGFSGDVCKCMPRWELARMQCICTSLCVMYLNQPLCNVFELSGVWKLIWVASEQFSFLCQLEFGWKSIIFWLPFWSHIRNTHLQSLTDEPRKYPPSQNAFFVQFQLKLLITGLSKNQPSNFQTCSWGSPKARSV